MTPWTRSIGAQGCLAGAVRPGVRERPPSGLAGICRDQGSRSCLGFLRRSPGAVGGSRRGRRADRCRRQGCGGGAVATARQSKRCDGCMELLAGGDNPQRQGDAGRMVSRPCRGPRSRRAVGVARPHSLSQVRTSGASRTRTGDLLGAIQALSQLSYSPGRGQGYPGDGARRRGALLRIRSGRETMPIR